MSPLQQGIFINTFSVLSSKPKHTVHKCTFIQSADPFINFILPLQRSCNESATQQAAPSQDFSPIWYMLHPKYTLYMCICNVLFGLWCHAVTWQLHINILEERTASILIIRYEYKDRMFIQKTESFCNTIWCRIPADSILHSEHHQYYKPPITLHHRSPIFLCKRATPIIVGWFMSCTEKNSSSPVTSLEWPRGFQEVKIPRFRDNSTGWW